MYLSRIWFTFTKNSIRVLEYVGQRELVGLTVGGVNPQVDGDGRYAFVGAGGAIRLPLDLLANLIEVCEFLPFAVEEFTPFWAKRKRVHTRTHARTR